MQIFSDPELLQSYITDQRIQGKIIGLVPTMGALHEGHSRLVIESMKSNDITVCSIYVNPTQFNDQQDLVKYPRNLNKDLEMLKELGCQAVFCPTDKVMYPTEPVLKMDFGQLEHLLEGHHRPGHFKGVALVVSKLFHLVQPDKAYFGEKDWQQLIVIKKLVEDLSFPVEIVGVPIAREPDGLALSSRNLRLRQQERAVANQLFIALQLVKAALEEKSSFESAISTGLDHLAQFSLIRVEYLEIVTAFTLEKPSAEMGSEPLSICIAAFLGDIRLIDNLQVFMNNVI